MYLSELGRYRMFGGVQRDCSRGALLHHPLPIARLCNDMSSCACGRQTLLLQRGQVTPLCSCGSHALSLWVSRTSLWCLPGIHQQHQPPAHTPAPAPPTAAPSDPGTPASGGLRSGVSGMSSRSTSSGGNGLSMDKRSSMQALTIGKARDLIDASDDGEKSEVGDSVGVS